jgi:hypothetical protein
MTPHFKETLRGFPCPPLALPEGVARLQQRADHQRLWLRLLRHEWRTLAVVPGEEGMSTYEVARLLVDLGVRHGESIGLFDVGAVEIEEILGVIKVACKQMSDRDRIIFAARSIKENLATIPLARATDGAVLCVSLGSTSLALVEETIEQVGKDRFFGSLLLQPPRNRGATAPRVPWLRRLEVRW